MKVRVPVLAISGETDTQVPAKEDLAAIEQALKDGGNNDYKIVLLPKLNHLFQTSNTGAPSEYGQIEETPLRPSRYRQWETGSSPILLARQEIDRVNCPANGPAFLTHYQRKWTGLNLSEVLRSPKRTQELSLVLG